MVVKGREGEQRKEEVKEEVEVRRREREGQGRR